MQVAAEWGRKCVTYAQSFAVPIVSHTARVSPVNIVRLTAHPLTANFSHYLNACAPEREDFCVEDHLFSWFYGSTRKDAGTTSIDRMSLVPYLDRIATWL